MKMPAPHNEKQRTTIVTFSIRLTDEVQVCGLSSGIILPQTAKVSKAINAGVVPVTPAGLQRITADQIESDEFETSFGIADVWTRNMTKDIGFATARRAWARAPQYLDLQKGFGAVVPSDGKLAADLLDVGWLKSHLSRRSFI
jgi:hypothetical protein